VNVTLLFPVPCPAPLSFPLPPPGEGVIPIQSRWGPGTEHIRNHSELHYFVTVSSIYLSSDWCHRHLGA